MDSPYEIQNVVFVLRMLRPSKLGLSIDAHNFKRTMHAHNSPISQHPENVNRNCQTVADTWHLVYNFYSSRHT